MTKFTFWEWVIAIALVLILASVIVPPYFRMQERERLMAECLADGNKEYVCAGMVGAGR